MKQVHRIRRKSRPIDPRDPPCLAILHPTQANLWKAETKLMRGLVADHLLPEIDRGRVVLHATISHDQRPRLMATLGVTDLERPRRWLRSRAPELRRAGVRIAAGAAMPRLRSGGVFKAVGFDVDYDLLCACAQDRVPNVKAVLSAHGARTRAWPQVGPSFAVLNSREAVLAAVRSVWSVDPDVDTTVSVFRADRMSRLHPLFASASVTATTAVRRLGARRLSSFMGLARNGDQLVRLKLTPSGPSERETETCIYGRKVGPGAAALPVGRSTLRSRSLPRRATGGL